MKPLLCPVSFFFKDWSFNFVEASLDLMWSYFNLSESLSARLAVKYAMDSCCLSPLKLRRNYEAENQCDELGTFTLIKW